VIRVGGADRDRTDDLFNAIPCSTLPTSVGPGKLEQRELSPVALPLSPLAEAPWYLAPKLGAVPPSVVGVSPALLTHRRSAFAITRLQKALQQIETSSTKPEPSWPSSQSTRATPGIVLRDRSRLQIPPLITFLKVKVGGNIARSGNAPDRVFNCCYLGLNPQHKT
jgi:hypothetical protein